MKELIFEVTEDIEGGYTASALGVGIHTQAESIEELKQMVRDAVNCYFDQTSTCVSSSNCITPNRPQNPIESRPNLKPEDPRPRAVHPAPVAERRF